MKLATKLNLAAGTSLIVALLVGLALFVSYSALIKYQEKGKIARQIVNGVYELNNLANLYMLHYEERPKQQFLLEYEAVKELIAKTRVKNKEQKRYLTGISRHLEAQKITFLNLVTNYERSESKINIPVREEAEERFSGQILIGSRDMAADAARLKELIDEEIAATQRAINILIILMVVGTTLLLAAVLLHMGRVISASFAIFRQVTQYVSTRDLDHHIGLKTPDEIGELARAFDLMIERLGEVTVSRDELLMEIEERKRAELEIGRISQFPLENPQPVLRLTTDGGVLYANAAARSWMEMSGWRSGTPPPDDVRNIIAEAWGQNHKVEAEITCPEGRSYLFVAIRPMGEDYINLYGMDITARKQAEQRIKDSLEEKETLLREIHHRVRNNLQVIRSLMNLQSASLKDSHLKAPFQEARNRISAMAVVHETLYRSDSIAELDLDFYVRRLASELRQLYCGSNLDVSCSIDINKVYVGHDQSVPCGLVMNELLSNAFKHAFKDRKSGVVQIKAFTDENNQVEISVADNGKGLPEGIDLRNLDSFGMKLIFRLVEAQLGGSVSIEHDEGARFIVRFPLKQRSDAPALKPA